eukprot:Sspe_Gene.27606::Locus_11976_Transcript_1_1_Confidence_1.000_Length_2015::g.27606::m.27606
MPCLPPSFRRSADEPPWHEAHLSARYPAKDLLLREAAVRGVVEIEEGVVRSMLREAFGRPPPRPAAPPPPVADPPPSKWTLLRKQRSRAVRRMRTLSRSSRDVRRASRRLSTVELPAEEGDEDPFVTVLGSRKTKKGTRRRRSSVNLTAMCSEEEGARQRLETDWLEGYEDLQSMEQSRLHRLRRKGKAPSNLRVYDPSTMGQLHDLGRTEMKARLRAENEELLERGEIVSRWRVMAVRLNCTIAGFRSDTPSVETMCRKGSWVSPKCPRIHLPRIVATPESAPPPQPAAPRAVSPPPPPADSIEAKLPWVTRFQQDLLDQGFGGKRAMLEEYRQRQKGNATVKAQPLPIIRPSSGHWFLTGR